MAPNGYRPVEYSKPLSGVSENDEVWLVQVPRHVDISEAEVVSDSEIKVGSSTFQLKQAPVPLGPCQILVPDTNSMLSALPVKPSKLMTLAKSVAIPKIDFEDVRSAKPKVPQKENLRMRHFPTGYGAASFGVDTTPVLRKRPLAESKPEAEAESEKHKHKKEKKDKKDKKDKKEKKEKKDKKHKSK